MGRRRRPLWGFERDLRHHINSYCKNDYYLSVEELVDHLRSTYRKYDSLQLRPFTERVRNVVLQLQQNPIEEVTHPRKKSKRNNNHQLEDGGGEGGELSTLTSFPESSNNPSSSSSDGENLEEDKPDLMQSMLRNMYIQQVGNNNNNTVESKKKVEEPELVYDNNDDNNSKKTQNILLKGRSRRRNGDLSEPVVEGGGSGGSGEEDRPMFDDLGGMDSDLEDLGWKVLLPLSNPNLFSILGVRPIRGILLHGPPGCGKTTLARAIANEAQVPFYHISATDLISGISGASEENIRDLFSKAYRTAPSIVFIDEIDAIASKRENLQREMERRVVTQLMMCMDEPHGLVKHVDAKGTTLPTDKRNSEATPEGSNGRPGHVLVIGATNRPDAIDPALRRPGRLDHEFALGFPDENARLQILSVLTGNLRVEGAFDIVKIARSTPGFVGADLVSLTTVAGELAMKRIGAARKVELSRELVDGKDAKKWWRKPWSPEEMEKLRINMADFEEAAKLVQPSSRREGFSAIPDVKWEDVGGLDSLRQEFDRFIVRRIKYPEHYRRLGMALETGFLLYGPPGCGKTLIAKAVANEAGANFIHIKGPEILNKYVGESESAIRTLFTRARTCSPCILFFDEFDALTTKRGKEGSWVVEKLLNQLLVELDGADQRKGVYVIGATNRPDSMDRAILRPGRLGRLLYVPLPRPDERGLILKALARGKAIDTNVDLMTIGRDDACKNLSGADLSALMNEASMLALEDLIALDTTPGDASWTIKESHFKRALEKVSPSVSDEEIKYYDHLSNILRPS